jgi:hypothetical protein
MMAEKCFVEHLMSHTDHMELMYTGYMTIIQIELDLLNIT